MKSTDGMSVDANCRPSKKGRIPRMESANIPQSFGNALFGNSNFGDGDGVQATTGEFFLDNPEEQTGLPNNWALVQYGARALNIYSIKEELREKTRIVSQCKY
jgi:hypothetical protein